MKTAHNRASEFRPKDDHYPTPREASVPFVRELHRLIGRPPFKPRIWEPACGDGALCKALIECGFDDLVATNLIPRGYGLHGVDFLMEHELRAPIIVTNPPASLATQFGIHAQRLGADMTALLVRTKFLAGRERYETLMKPHPPAFIYQFIERIKFFAGDTAKEDQPGWNTEDFAWFVWIKCHDGEPRVRWLSRGEG